MVPSKAIAKACRALSEGLAALLLGLIIASLAVGPLSAADLTQSGSQALTAAKAWDQPLSPDRQMLHLLSRIAFGPRPGDVERVRRTGIEAFLDQQLQPESIDDSAVESLVAKLPTLSMSPEELIENYPQPKKAFKREERRRGLAEGARPGAGGRQPSSEPSRAMQEMRPGMAEMEGPRRIIMELAQEEVLRAVYSNRQLQEVMAQFWMNHFNIFAPKGADKWLTTSFERDTIRPRALGNFEDLLVATAKSPAMLFYLDNWMSTAPNSSPSYYRRPDRPAPMGGRVIRPWGPFGMGRRGPFGGPGYGRDRLGGRPVGQAKKQNKRGLNENYAREVMELHTLGVEGGYTQKDVLEVARCLTGWTIDRPRFGGRFVFNPSMHDLGSKVVLGHKIGSGRGMEDGIEVLRLLAHHPSTARFISLKLCRRFIADDPPRSAVDRASQTFLKTGGDIRAVLKTILKSPEFYSEAAFHAKVKSPLELVASSLRALDARTDAELPLLKMIARMGQPMFQYQAPTGFPDRASTWINSGALLMRINFAMMLASNRIPGTSVDWSALAPPKGKASPEASLEALDRQLLAGTLAPETREAILKKVTADNGNAALGAPPGPEDEDVEDDEEPAEHHSVSGPERGSISTLAALLLASPDFQRR